MTFWNVLISIRMWQDVTVMVYNYTEAFRVLLDDTNGIVNTINNSGIVSQIRYKKILIVKIELTENSIFRKYYYILHVPQTQHPFHKLEVSNYITSTS